MSELDEHVENNSTPEQEEYKIPDYFFKPERQEGESFFDYKKRRLLERFMLKEIKKCSVVWKSVYEVSKGRYAGVTYNKKAVAEYVKNKLKEQENGNNQESEGAE